jgi:uncharacterized phage protein (predicted DNA packaging)
MDLLVTVAEAKEYIRVDGDGEDGLISSLILLAQQYVNNVLKWEVTKETMEPSIRLAIILVTEHFYEERSGEDIPDAVLTLLRPYRKVGW